MLWSQNVNGFVYEIVVLILQTARVHNVTIPGRKKYSVPSGNITIDNDAASTPTLSPYSIVAITGADRFRDDNTRVKDIFDTFVEITRDITPTCEFPTTRSYPLVLIDPVSNQVGTVLPPMYV